MTQRYALALGRGPRINGQSSASIRRPFRNAKPRQDSASSSSSLRWPGTMATGMGKSPAFLARLETSGPGPFLLVAAASTRAAIIFVVPNKVEDLLRFVAFTDHALRRHARDA